MQITALINDKNSNYPWPLLYTVEVTSLDHDSVLSAVMVERMADTGCDADELELELILAMPGNVNTCADWRG